MSFTKNFKQKLQDVFSEAQLSRIGRSTGFLARKSKLTCQMFIDILLFKDLDNGQVSLNDHAAELRLRHGVKITKQSLHERFTDKAVAFFKQLLEMQLSSQIKKELDTGLLKRFTSVKIKDSTRFQLPKHLAADYPGSTGVASGAGVHIQFEFDLLNGHVSDLNPTDAMRQDQTDAAETLKDVEKGSLLIRDLGYYSHHVLEGIDRAGAYYISRVKPSVMLYQADNGGGYSAIDLKKLHRDMKKNGLDHCEIPIFIGEKKIATRLIVEMLPEQVVAKRIAKAQKEARKKGRQLSKKYREYAALNLFITNVPTAWLPTCHVRTLYRLRWQVELRFKAWKSFCKLHKTKPMKKHRIECYLYASLLYIILNWEIAINFLGIIWKYEGLMISMMKFYKTIRQQTHRMRKVIVEDIETTQEFIFDLYSISRELLLLEKRKKKVSLGEIMLLTIDNELVIC